MGGDSKDDAGDILSVDQTDGMGVGWGESLLIELLIPVNCVQFSCIGLTWVGGVGWDPAHSFFQVHPWWGGRRMPPPQAFNVCSAFFLMLMGG